MGQLEILNKLRNKLSSVPKNEEDIVFVLSRIRKILEFKEYNLSSKYGVLLFYCNLALHVRIDRVPKELRDELVRAHSQQSYTHPFYGYHDLHQQIQSFMNEYDLPNFYENPDFQGQKIIDILNSIYSDTPVMINGKYQVFINKDGTVTGSYL